MARNRFSFEKRRKELEKQKKKEAKREARTERKAAIAAGEEVVEPIITIDEFGNVVETWPEGTGPDAVKDDADPDDDADDTDDETSSPA